MLKESLMNLVNQYGSIVIFWGLILEYIGLPIPGETLLTFLGFVSWKSSGLSLYSSLIISTTGAFIGSNLAFLIGRKYGKSILLKFGRYIHITKDKLDSAGTSFERRKVLLILFGKYIPGVRHVIPYLSGISKIKIRTYLLLNLIGSAMWCLSFICLGYILGERWVVVEKLIKVYSFEIILIAAFIFIVVKFFNKHKLTIFSIAFPLLLFIKLIEDLIKNELSSFDNVIYDSLSRIISKDMTRFMKLITFLGSGQVLILISIACIIVFWRNDKFSFYSKMIGVNLLAISALNEIFKVIFHRARPDILRLVWAGGFSFPSGHSMNSIGFYGFIAYIFYISMQSRLKYLIISMFSVLILLIGISRIYLGVHYASDVLAGFSAGLAWLAIFITIITKSNLRKKSDNF